MKIKSDSKCYNIIEWTFTHIMDKCKNRQIAGLPLIRTLTITFLKSEKLSSVMFATEPMHKFAISAAWRSPFRSGRPLATMYESLIVST